MKRNEAFWRIVRFNNSFVENQLRKKIELSRHFVFVRRSKAISKLLETLYFACIFFLTLVSLKNETKRIVRPTVRY